MTAFHSSPFSAEAIFKGSSVLLPSHLQLAQQITRLSSFVGIAETRERMKQCNDLSTVPSLSEMLLALKFDMRCLKKKKKAAENSMTLDGKKRTIRICKTFLLIPVCREF